jgi:hypothetical protein
VKRLGALIIRNILRIKNNLAHRLRYLLKRKLSSSRKET